MKEAGAALNSGSFFVLVLIALVVALIARRMRIPYALALVVAGLVIGATRLLPQVRLEPDLLFGIFLPPLLFEAAINLRSGPLLREWKMIAVYTLAGTLVAAFFVAGLVHWALGVPLAVAFVFGALIAATDPISVLSIFKRLGASQRLTLVVEAESLFNDGIAVVLFTVALSVAKAAVSSGAAAAAPTIGEAVLRFVTLVGGGALLGAAIGALGSLVHFDLNDHLIEITLTTVVAFGAYVAAEALHVSGVVAVVAAGLVIGNWGMQTAMTPGTRLAVGAFWEYAGFVVNSLVFLLVGIESGSVRWKDKIGFAAFSVAVVLAGRAAAVYPLSVVLRWIGSPVPRSWQHIFFWGGLRGALSMALVLGLPRDFPLRDLLVAGTFGVVLFSLLVQGASLGPLLRRLELSSAQRQRAQSPQQRRLAGEVVAVEAALLELERLRQTEAHPDWSVELLTREYRERLTQVEARLDQVQPDHRVERSRRMNRARRLALTAEKSALHEAQQQGWLDAADWRDTEARINAQLLALQTDEDGGPPATPENGE